MTLSPGLLQISAFDYKSTLKKINPAFEIVYNITTDLIPLCKGYFFPILNISKTF